MKPQNCQIFCITNLSDLEESRRTGLLVSWEELMAVDLTSTFYQGPVWCMEWYRSYSDCFSPLVLLMTEDRALVGIVPLAIEKATGRLTFATDNMADYRDVVSRPSYRTVVVAELLRFYQTGSFPNTFWLGPTQPESTTVDLVCALTAHKSKLHAITRSHSCWRLSFSDPDAAIRATTKKSVRRRINYYEREGPLLLQRINDINDWDVIRLEFFNQHSQRQLAVGRPTSFDAETKRRFYDNLVRNHAEMVHVTILRVADRFIAGHYGYMWRNVLYWGASTFDVKEGKHSPGQILVALLVQNASAVGLSCVDFTLGTEEFKVRFGNHCVELRSVEIYASSTEYLIRKVRDHIVTRAKSVVGGIAGPEGWILIKRFVKKYL